MTTMTHRLAPARMRASDVLMVGAAGLRTRPMRAFLSALGIAIGIAAMVAVVGVSTSSRADLQETLDRLGTNLLTAGPGNDIFGDAATLPDESVEMIRRIGPVTAVSAVGKVPDAKVYRSDRIPEVETNGLLCLAARVDLLSTVSATVASGTWLNEATAKYPAVVLGSAAADRLGIGAAGQDVQVYIGGEWFTVIGVLDPTPLAPELDSAALIGWGPRSPIWTSTAIRPLCTPGPRRSTSRPSVTCSPPPPTRRPRARSTSPARPTRWRRSRQRIGRSPACCWGLARWPCWSAAWAWRTRWSSRCSNAAPRSACAARSARRGARSASSSCPSPCCCPHWAAPAAWYWARRSRPSTPRRRTGPRWYHPGPRPAASARRWSSARPPACTRRSAPPASPDGGTGHTLTHRLLDRVAAGA
ncbi:hypothetical protein Pflav_024890 [Phytohabitans flavus]|uniref:MacB-like periplasmic core domain-containing protein n=1 Tax=Phytohabitans flavus TaxID=1076124 RepID=A0A6F8XQL1_9ACTN|nr:hypothetical protein Pflav_024890 [Phytohabitans flavus]